MCVHWFVSEKKGNIIKNEEKESEEEEGGGGEEERRRGEYPHLNFDLGTPLSHYLITCNLNNCSEWPQRGAD